MKRVHDATMTKKILMVVTSHAELSSVRLGFIDVAALSVVDLSAFGKSFSVARLSPDPDLLLNKPPCNSLVGIFQHLRVVMGGDCPGWFRNNELLATSPFSPSTSSVRAFGSCFCASQSRRDEH